MIVKLAIRNLFHDRVSLIVTLVGIVFAVVLVAIQLGLYLGSQQMILAMISHTKADIWVVSTKTKSFDDPAILPTREKHTVLSVPGVAAAAELVVGFAEWQKPGGGALPIVLVGANHEDGGLAPWNIIEGSAAELALPGGIAVDKTYFGDLDVTGIGDDVQIGGQRARVVAVTRGIRSFTTLPYIFATLDQARTYLGVSNSDSTFIAIRLEPGVDRAAVAQALAAKLNGGVTSGVERFHNRVEVISTEHFGALSVARWLYGTGAGAALIAGAALGLIVGTVIVAQTLYATIKDHLNEFGTLRALGASSSYLHRVILVQAVVSAVLGFVLGMLLAQIIVHASRNSNLIILITPLLAAQIFGLTLAMCVISALSAIFKVTRIDPAMVFSR